MSLIKLEPVDPCLPDASVLRPKAEISVGEETVDPDVKVEEDCWLNDPVGMRFLFS